MCGIIGMFGKTDKDSRRVAMEMARLIRHRGPDWSGIYEDDCAILCHERLSIVDVAHGAQPLVDQKTGSVLAVNGEIYTHKELKKLLKKDHKWQTKSDCEVLLYLYDEFGPRFLDSVNGIFAFVIYDKKSRKYFAARDHIGIVPLYYGTDESGRIYFASELKALDRHCSTIDEFPPGHYYIGSIGDKFDARGFVRWYTPSWEETMPTKQVSHEELRAALELAVKRQMMSDVPYGVLISGGLDSSLIAAIAAKHRKMRIENDEREEAWWPQLHSFSVGLADSPDMKYAKIVSKHIGTVHHEIVFTIQEGFDAIRDVIYHLETFDTTTIRAATPMYLMARKIKSMGIKMVLSGEGADELFGGYLYFHMAPSPEEFHKETVRKLFALSKYDCLRANKSTAAWGLEARVPFLDKEFLDVAMSMDPRLKMCPGKTIEKKFLRDAFKGYIPDEILYRQKEQFSDGVGYGWIDYLKRYAEEHVTNEEVTRAHEKFPIQTPTSKEQYYYRTLFDELFSKKAASTVPVGASIACSSPTAFRWSKEFAKMDDPSGRAVAGVHEQAIKKTQKQHSEKKKTKF